MLCAVRIMKVTKYAITELERSMKLAAEREEYGSASDMKRIKEGIENHNEMTFTENEIAQLRKNVQREISDLERSRQQKIRELERKKSEVEKQIDAKHSGLSKDLTSAEDTVAKIT